MAVAVQQPQIRNKKDILDTISQGVGIAANLIGTGFAIPKFLQERQAIKQGQERLDLAKQSADADFATKFKEVPGTPQSLADKVKASQRSTFLQTPLSEAATRPEGAVERGGKFFVPRESPSTSVMAQIDKSLAADAERGIFTVIRDNKMVKVKKGDIDPGDQTVDSAGAFRIAQGVTSSQRGAERIILSGDAFELRQGQENEKRRQTIDKKRLAFVDKFNKDKVVQKNDEMIAASTNMLAQLNLVKEGNPIAAEAVKTFGARASGEVGNLTEADLQRFGGSKALSERLSQGLQQALTGTLTPTNIGFLEDVAKAMSSSAAENRVSRGATLSRQFAKTTEDFNESEMRDIFGLPAVGDPDSPDADVEGALNALFGE